MSRAIALLVLVVCAQFPVLGLLVWLIAHWVDPIDHPVLVDLALKGALLLGMFVHASWTGGDEEEEEDWQ